MPNKLKSFLVAFDWIGLAYLCITTIIIGSITFRVLLGSNTPLYTVDTKQAGRIATVFLKSPKTQFEAKTPAPLQLVLDTGGAVVREATIVMSYTPELVSSISLSFNRSTCASVKEQRINEKIGTLTIVCERFNAATTQLQTLATLTITPTGNESPVLRFDSKTDVISTKDKSVLKDTQPFVMSLGSITTTNPSLVSIAGTNTTPGGCSTSATTSFVWLKTIGVNKFLYSWNEETPVAPATTTIATNGSFPLKPGSIHFLSIRSVTDNGTLGPIRTERVVSCP